MARYQLLLPKMGESVAEATIIKWVKKPGDYIDADDAVIEIATDKVDSEVPSPVSGKLIEQLCKEDDIVQVGSVVAIIETDDSEDAVDDDQQQVNESDITEEAIEDTAPVEDVKQPVIAEHKPGPQYFTPPTQQTKQEENLQQP